MQEQNMEKDNSDLDLKQEAEDWANKVVSMIEDAMNSPKVGLDKNASKIYDELLEAGIIEENKITDREFAVKHLYLNRYKELRYIKENPKKSKWEVVMGATSGRKRPR